MDLKRLKARWGWTTLLTVIVSGVLVLIDGRVKAASGSGIFDLELAATAVQVNTITGAWQAAGVADEMGFLLGLDYLYMGLYGSSLLYGALAAREAFAREPGPTRRVLTFLAFAPLLGAGFDVCENFCEVTMLFERASDALARVSYTFTLAKFAGVLVGLVLALAGLAGLLTGRLGSVRGVGG